NVALFGQISPGESGPRFDGQVEMVSDDVRAVIAWLDLLNVSDIPTDRLRRFSLTAAVGADETGGEVSALDLRIDASRLKGYANFTLGTRNSLDANLHLDRLNADAYLAAEGDARTAIEAARAGGDAAAESDGGRAGGGAPESGGLAFLDTLDAALKLTAGRLSYGGAVLSGVTFEGVLKDNILTLRRFDVSDLSGAKLALNGEIRDLAGAPDVNLSFDVKADSIFALIRVAGIDPNFRADNLGAVRLSGSLSGGRRAVNLNARLDTRPAVLSLVGSITTPLDNAALNMGLELRAPDAAELLRAANITPPKLARRLGALALDGGLDGGFEALNMSLSARAAGNHLQVAGNLADFSGGGRYNLAFDLTNPSFAALAELLSGAAYEGEDVGAVRVKGRLAGDAEAVAISELSLALGKTRIAGTADLKLGGPVPILRANLEAGLLDAGLFIGGATAAAEEAEAAGSGGGANASPDRDPAAQSGERREQRRGERWSREPFDLSPLAEIEADISVLADAILAGGYRFDEAEFKFRIAGGALEIDSLRGRIFDGLLEAEGRIADADPPQVSFAFKLDNMDLASALRQAGDVEAVTGRASLDGRFASEGHSEYDLVRALQGDATLNALNGTVEGLDLRVLSDRLSALNDPADFLKLADVGLSGGTTRLDSLAGTIRVKNGLATTSDLLLLADGGRGTVRGTADLPSWRLDLTALFDLTDHPKAPPIGVRMTGAIDNPARELLISDMQAYLMERVFKTAIGKFVLPKLRKGAKAEPGSIEDTLLRGIFGDPDDGAPERSTDDAQPPPAEDSQPASIEDILLRGVLGDILEGAPNSARPPAEQSEPALAPQRGGSESTGPAPQIDGAEPAGLAPQQGERRAERAPAPDPAPAPERAPERADNDPLSPQDILRGVFDILDD
ncbi:MAG: AsmA-like C-terminal region-containing protein, partial [Alphaproteobacteria bacterium]